MFGSGKTRITSLLTNLRLASVELKEKDMKLLELYVYEYTTMYKFIYPFNTTGYIWRPEYVLTESSTLTLHYLFNKIRKKNT